MARIFTSVEQLIGHTPLLELAKLGGKYSLHAKILAKLECFNPAGSSKDRVALSMIEEAEKSGKLKPGGVIIEPTSGNTGIGLAMISAIRGYRLILTMPESMSLERQLLIKAYGAEIVLTEGTKGMQGAIDKALELVKTVPGSIIPDQFANPANADAHRVSTGPEIYQDTDGKIDYFVATVGTGGTITGTGEYLKSQNKDIKVVAVEPAASPVLSRGKAGIHNIQGIGAGFVPKTLNPQIYDEVIAVTDQEAYIWGREMVKTEGLLVGISSGAALAAALKLAQKKENEGKTIVVLLPDIGNRYLSTPMFK